jgi:hypothetical protein
MVSLAAATAGLLSMVTVFNWHSHQPYLRTPTGLTVEFRRRFDVQGTQGHVELKTEKLVYVTHGIGDPFNPPPVVDVFTVINGQPTNVRSPPWIFPRLPRSVNWRACGFEYRSGGGSRTNGPKPYISQQVETYRSVVIPSWMFFAPAIVCSLVIARRSLFLDIKSVRGVDIKQT